MKLKQPTAQNLLIPLLAMMLVSVSCLAQGNEPSERTSNLKNAPPMITLTHYLLLDGTCKAAMEFYRSCLGGELTMTLVGNSPMKTVFPAAMHNKVLNSRLLSAGIVISASDWLRPQQTPVQGNTVCLYLSGGSYAELKSVFDKLADGASVTDPLKEEPFGTYGALNDKFGIRWMFHAETKD